MIPMQCRAAAVIRVDARSLASAARRSTLAPGDAHAMTCSISGVSPSFRSCLKTAKARVRVSPESVLRATAVRRSMGALLERVPDLCVLIIGLTHVVAAYEKGTDSSPNTREILHFSWYGHCSDFHLGNWYIGKASHAPTDPLLGRDSASGPGGHVRAGPRQVEGAGRIRHQ